MTRQASLLGSARNREPAPGPPSVRVDALRRAAAGLLWLAYALGACQAAASGQNTSSVADTVNPVVAGGLRESIALEILELDQSQGDLDYERLLYLTESEQLSRLIGALDAELPLQPASRCIPRYRLRFDLANGESKELSYICESGEAILRGDQDFWSGGEVTPPQGFQDQLHELIESRNDTPAARSNRGLTRHSAAGGPRR